MEYSETAAQVAAEASVTTKRSKKTRSSRDQERAQSTLQRCRNCSRTGHNARTYKKGTKISSDTDASTTYIGSLFDSDEIEEL
jgi:hypothetical protein